MLINTPRFLSICLMTQKVVVEHTQTYKHSQRTCGWSSHIPFHRCRLPYLHNHPSWRCGCSCFWGTPTVPHNPLMPIFVRKPPWGPIHELRWVPYTLHLVPIPAGRMLGWASAEVVVLQKPHLAVPDQVLTAFFFITNFHVPFILFKLTALFQKIICNSLVAVQSCWWSSSLSWWILGKHPWALLGILFVHTAYTPIPAFLAVIQATLQRTGCVNTHIASLWNHHWGRIRLTQWKGEPSSTAMAPCKLPVN